MSTVIEGPFLHLEVFQQIHKKEPVEQERHQFATLDVLIDLSIGHQRVRTSQQDRPPDTTCFLMEEHTPCDVLPKASSLNLIKALGPITDV